MNDLENYYEGANWWEVNPQLCHIEAFKSFREQDKSKGNKESSQIMWAIAFVYNYKSDYQDLTFDDRVEVTEKDFLNQPGFFKKKEKELAPVIREYMKLQFDAPRRLVAELHDFMDKRRDFIRDTPITTDWVDEKGKRVPGTAKLLDDMAKNSKALYDHYKRIKQEVLNEEAKTNAKGGAETGLLESGKI